MSIFDYLLNLRPGGIAGGLPRMDNAARIAAVNETPDEGTFRTGMIGLGRLPASVHLVNPYHPNVDGGAFPPVSLHPRFLPPNVRSGSLPPGLMATPGLRLGHLLAPGQEVRKGIAHPGRRLGHTGNPGLHPPGRP